MENARRRRGRTSAEAAYTQLAMGAAFVVIAVILGVTGKGGGWWFWMFVPAFMFLAGGIAKVAQSRNNRSHAEFSQPQDSIGPASQAARLSPAQTEFIPAAESSYKTGDLVPPSVTESTTRHLEVDSEGKTMTLPKD